jgi:hypothetical protein
MCGGPMNTDSVAHALLKSDEPAIRFKIRTGYFGEDPNSKAIRALRNEIRDSALVACLLRRALGRRKSSVYAKWQGPHWSMAALADIGYPAGDKRLFPIRDQLQEHWLDEHFYQDVEVKTRAEAYAQEGVPVIQGRHRRCGSQQANALWSILTLGIANKRTHDFVERLLHWQWPDGGWNCDKNPKACHSSFMESILPLRALARYGRRHNHEPALMAAKRAAEIFLVRQMYLRRSTQRVIRGEFAELHYPLYWHYDILHGLKVMAEAGFIRDKRCRRALDLLAGKQLPDGGWPAERKYYKASNQPRHGNDDVDWGGTSRKVMNPWVTADALFVLRAVGDINSIRTPQAARRRFAVG